MANTGVYFTPGGNTLVVGDGGTLDTTAGNVTFGPIAIGADGVATVNIQDFAVTTGKINLLAVDTAQLADAAVTNGKLANDAVETVNITDLNVTTGKLANTSVTFAKAGTFLSVEETATGMAQNIAHGLGSTPAAVLIVPTDTSGTMTPGEYVIGYTKNGTNVVVTATADLKYVVFAWK